MALTQAMPRARHRVRFRLGATKQDWPWALVFLAPNLVLFLVFFAYPIVYGLYISLFNWKIIGPKKWVGLDNYVTFFNDDKTV